MRGRSGVGNEFADGFGSQRLFVIDSGTGTIEIVGDQTSSGGGVICALAARIIILMLQFRSAEESIACNKNCWFFANKGDGWAKELQVLRKGTVVFVQSSADVGGGTTDVRGFGFSQTTTSFDHVTFWGDESSSSIDIPNVYQFLRLMGRWKFQSLINSVSSEIAFYADNISRSTQGRCPGSRGGTYCRISRCHHKIHVGVLGNQFSDSVFGTGSIGDFIRPVRPLGLA